LEEEEEEEEELAAPKIERSGKKGFYSSRI